MPAWLKPDKVWQIFVLLDIHNKTTAFLNILDFKLKKQIPSLKPSKETDMKENT